MGWTRYLLLGDIGQQLDLHDHARRIDRFTSAQRAGLRRDLEQDARIDELEQEVMQLNAGLAALVGLMRDKQVVTEQEIMAALERSAREVEQADELEKQSKQAQEEVQRKEAMARKLERVRRRKDKPS